MSAALKTLLVAGAIVGAAGCHKAQSEQNIAIDNGIDANAAIETLPADESSTTPSNQLVNGDDSPEVNDLNASNN